VFGRPCSGACVALPHYLFADIPYWADALGGLPRDLALGKDELMMQQGSTSIPCAAYELLAHERPVAGVPYLVRDSSKQQVTSLGMNQTLGFASTA